VNTKRIPDRAGFVGTVQACRWCGKPKPWDDKHRRTFCSDECVKEHKIRTQPDYAAELVLKRDNGVCCVCGLDTVALRRDLETRLLVAIAVNIRRPLECRRIESMYKPCEHDDCISWAVEHAIQRDTRPYHAGMAHPAFVEWCTANSIPPHLRKGKRRLWEMDHITPVVEGGADCGLDNLRTLCWLCHRRETTALAGRRAAKRKRAVQP
jgi:5-methylcytosine-specific restriction endonuclease McrA